MHRVPDPACKRHDEISSLAYSQAQGDIHMATNTKTRTHFRAGFLIHDVSRLRRTVFDQKLKPLGITRSQWWVLTNLARHDGQGYAQIELARLLDVGKVTLGGLIDRLEENELVMRVPDKLDRRSKRVKMSRKGKNLLKKVENIGAVVNKEIMRGISTDDENELIRILKKMKLNLIDMDAVPASTAGRKPATNE